jgi:2-epi-5-epi-valiolone synthase
MTSAWQVPANAERTYDVRVAEPLLEDGSYLLEGGHLPGRRFVVLDSGIPETWHGRLRHYFSARGVEGHFMVVPGGGRGKSMETVTAILDELRRFCLARRNEPIIAIGGRAVLDAVGFAASLYRRGVPLVRVPSTLLGYVDAAVSVKTSVNYGGVRNLIGSISSPRLVLLEREFLGSLSPETFASGLGALLRLGVACDRALFDLLDADADGFAASRLRDGPGLAVLRQSTEAMLAAVRHNVAERQPSAVLELGHTFSPVFEAAAGNGAVRHGEAVALEVNLTAIIAARRRLLDENSLRRLAVLTERLGVTTAVPDIAPHAFWSALLRQQASGGWPRVPLPRRIGECCFVEDLAPDELATALRDLQGDHFRTRRAQLS